MGKIRFGSPDNSSPRNPTKVEYVERIIEKPIEKIIEVEKIIEKRVYMPTTVERIEVPMIVPAESVDLSPIFEKIQEERQYSEIKFAELDNAYNDIIEGCVDFETSVKKEFDEIDLKFEVSEASFKQKFNELEKQNKKQRLLILALGLVAILGLFL